MPAVWLWALPCNDAATAIGSSYDAERAPLVAERDGRPPETEYEDYLAAMAGSALTPT